MSPRWATVVGYGLYFYPNERHRRPHVDVMHGMEGAVVDLMTGEILAGELPPKVSRAVREFLEEYRDEALHAFYLTLDHRFPGGFEPGKEVGHE
jgi:hypothetical protein